MLDLLVEDANTWNERAKAVARTGTGDVVSGLERMKELEDSVLLVRRRV